MSASHASAGQRRDLRERLSLALRTAIGDRDQAATAALRSALAAIANAEAVSSDSAPAARTSPHFAGAATGLGGAEVARRELSETAIEDIVRAEAAERQLAADQYAEAGHAGHAARLRTEAGVLLAVLGDDATLRPARP
jgi:uncharacterized protein YqeY